MSGDYECIKCGAVVPEGILLCSECARERERILKGAEE